jgi:hypothetical protein
MALPPKARWGKVFVGAALPADESAGDAITPDQSGGESGPDSPTPNMPLLRKYEWQQIVEVAGRK